MESAILLLVEQFRLKKHFMENSFPSYVASQNTWLEDLLTNSSDLGDVVTQARDFVPMQLSVKEEFLKRHHNLIETKLLPLLQVPINSANELEVRLYYTQAQSDPILNAADPVWIFFLNSIGTLSLNGTSLTSLARLCNFVKKCERWTPDSACLTRQSQIGLDFVFEPRSGHFISGYFYPLSHLF
jgi:hypothetical protein